MTGYIYLIQNSITGAGYVGQTITSVAKRFSQHKIDARSEKDFHLYRAMRKYGVENFTVTAIASCEDGDFLNELERHYIKFFGTFSSDGHGYNATLGGDGQTGRACSEATRHKLRIANLGKRYSEETRAKLSAMRRGMKWGPRSLEARMRMSEAAKGRKHTPEQTAKISAALKGRARSEETKAKIRATKALRRSL